MALLGYNQTNHNQQMDEYEYDDADEFYDDNINSYNAYNNHAVDDSEGNEKIVTQFRLNNMIMINIILIYRY